LEYKESFAISQTYDGLSLPSLGFIAYSSVASLKNQPGSMMVLATLMRFSKLWFSQFWNCILPLRGGLGGANAFFGSFLSRRKK
jgi:hypothetical protein